MSTPEPRPKPRVLIGKRVPITVLFKPEELEGVQLYAANSGRKLSTFLRFLALRESNQLPSVNPILVEDEDEDSETEPT